MQKFVTRHKTVIDAVMTGSRAQLNGWRPLMNIDEGGEYSQKR